MLLSALSLGRVVGWSGYVLLMMAIVCVPPGRAGRVDAAGLDPTVTSQVQSATFEVVAAKPVGDNLTYARPLPLDLLPFQERNDKYFSVGSAFSLGGNRFLSAAHVIATCLGGLWGAPALRDSDGNVYPIDRIEKFSLARDFVVFSVTGNPKAALLRVNAEPVLNGLVYAVGNALGTGIVVRDGLYTSKTPEEQDGHWKWLRFSAAVSPGNSGGPLLDQNGAVIGLVLRKSPNENLNFALPIEEVIQAPDHQADIDNRFTRQLDIFDTVQSGTFNARFALPLSYSAFSAIFLKLANAFSDAQLKALLEKEPEKVFPNGQGSSHLLHNVSRMQYFPALIVRQSNGEWVISDHKGTRTPLPAHGYVVSGTFGRELLFRLRRPDDIAASTLQADGELLMNQLLAGGFLQRTVATEKVQVTGLGKPIEESAHTDGWRRRWQARVWPLPFANMMLVTLSLPVPDGYVTIARYSWANHWHENMMDLEATADFVDAGYWGTLAQWKEFLAAPTYLPPPLKAVTLKYDYGHRFSFASSRVGISLNETLQDISPKSLLGLGFQYLGAEGKPTWDIGDIRLQTDEEDYGHWVAIERHVEPSPNLEESYKSTWDKILRRQHPYDGFAYSENDVTRIAIRVGGSDSAVRSVSYTGFVGASGPVAQDAMRTKLDDLLAGIRVKEGN